MSRTARLREYRYSRREAMQELGKLAHREAVIAKLQARLAKRRDAILDRISTIDFCIREQRKRGND